MSTSYRGGSLPYEDVLKVADLVLLHGNGVTDPTIMAWLIDRTRMRLRGRQIPDRRQRGRSLRVRPAVEQFAGGGEPLCVVGPL